MIDSGKTEGAKRWLAQALGVPSAFPWQQALLERMLAGELPSALDVPTGLGKTAVMAIWLVARARGAAVPRRLVYVVDRRAVVDQATTVAEHLRRFVGEHAELRAGLGLEGDMQLPISTLRGQFIDNRAWLADPGAPAIVLGTVDMVGSRLLFEGYGVSRRMRPYHAGLLGADALVVLDEAHLVPPFEHLVRTIARADEEGLGGAAVASTIVPRLRVLSLSATGRATAGALTLSEADRADLVVARRLGATKQLIVRDTVSAKELAARLAEEAWAITESGTKPVRCIVFCDRRDDAQAVAAQLSKQVGARAADHVELFVGGRRTWERSQAAQWLEAKGFLAGRAVKLERSCFVIATSAGEVGVDLDADHMISDLVAWERMVQRLGRVNRRGEGAARVVVVPAEPKADDAMQAARVEAVRSLLRELPVTAGNARDASPGALVELKNRAASEDRLHELLDVATTPEPLRPALTRPLVEAWSMTSLEDHTGRPEVAPWLRGWDPEDVPQTTVVWRDLLPLTSSGRLVKELDEFLDAAGPHLAEELELENWRVVEWLRKRVTAAMRRSEVEGAGEPALARVALNDVIGVVLSRSGNSTLVAREVVSKEKRDLERLLANATLLVDTRLGGLGDHGLLDDSSDTARDVTTQSAPDGSRPVPFRVRHVVRDAEHESEESDATGARWRTELSITVKRSDAGDETEWLEIQSLADAPAASEEGRAVGATRAQSLDDHEEWTERAARRIAANVGVPSEYATVLALAARLHDEGKRARRWQQAFRAPSEGGPYAKTTSRPNLRVLGRYRHELGSLPYAERDERVRALPADLRDLCLHLIASHHGFARPVIRIDGADEPPSKLAQRAQDIALRFTRLEKHWGPWGLAWWEALLRAADQQASRENDEGGRHG